VNTNPRSSDKSQRILNNGNRVRISKVQTLSDDWYLLKKTTFDYLRRDGCWETVTRETYDRGNGATILLLNRRRGTVLLTRQFRFPTYVNGLEDGMLVEACAGLLDNQSPEAAIRREAEEELGVTVNQVQKVLEAYMSPGSVTEKLYSVNTKSESQISPEIFMRAKKSKFLS
jgi:GDP-mannose pyrophosphatase NudK